MPAGEAILSFVRTRTEVIVRLIGESHHKTMLRIKRAPVKGSVVKMWGGDEVSVGDADAFVAERMVFLGTRYKSEGVHALAASAAEAYAVAVHTAFLDDLEA